MTEDTTQAASSTAEVDVFGGQEPTLAEFNQYREKGEVPERFKPAVSESASDDTQEETEEAEAEKPEPEPDSEPDDKQEPQPKASKRDKRIQQLLDETNDLKRQLSAKSDVKDSSPKPAEPQHAFPKPTAEDKKDDGSLKYETYEDFVEATSRWAAKEERTTWEREQQQKDAHKALQVKLDEARARYDDADAVIFPAENSIMSAPQIPLAVKAVFGESELYVDLCYVVGSDPEELAKFVALAQTNPRAAIGKVFEYERGIREELSKSRDDKGKFTAPEGKQTKAPKPPSPVGGASIRAFDVSDDSLSPEEWARQRTKQLQSR